MSAMGALGKIIFYSMITLIVLFTAIIILILSFALSDSTTTVMSSNTAPVANLGGDQLLSCYLRTQSASQVSVTWTKKDLKGNVYQYKNGAAALKEQSSQFRGRTQLFPDALLTGNASLLLRSVRMSDEGRYTCTISSSESGGTVNLHLWTAAFTAPTFTYTNNILAANADRWFPKPNVTWLDLDEDVLDGDTSFSKSPSGIYGVLSTLSPVNASGIYTCRIENDLVISVSEATVKGVSLKCLLC